MEKESSDFQKTPEETSFKSPEIYQVTDRTYKQYLSMLSLAESDLAGKTIVDLGSGLANFAETANSKWEASGTKVLAVDPTYSWLNSAQQFEEFSKYAETANLIPQLGYGQVEHEDDMLPLEERARKLQEFYSEFLEKVKNGEGTYIAGSHQAIPVKTDSVDLVLSNNCVTLIDDPSRLFIAFGEIDRILRSNGEARFRPIPSGLRYYNEQNKFVLTKAQLEPKEEIKRFHNEPVFDYERLITYQALEQRQGSFYVENARSQRSQIFGPIVLIFRKDRLAPIITEQSDELTARLYKLNFRQSPDGFNIPADLVWQSA